MTAKSGGDDDEEGARPAARGPRDARAAVRPHIH